MFAGAAFTDEADIQAKDAVSMLTTLGVIEGYEDGSFQPEGTVTRAEMAKMIFVVRNNTADDKAYANVSTTLTDISGHWAEGYIKFCESQGIIAGYGDGTFKPDEIVTGTEAAKMLLVLTGYEPEKAGLTGSNWATNTLKHAGAAGILDKVSSGLESGLPRQWAAQMIYNTLSASRVVWSSDSQSFDNVLNGGVQETVGRAYMGLYASVGTLVGIDLDEITLANIDLNESDPVDSVWTNGQWNGVYPNVFSKLTTDYSDLLGQEVKVMFKDANTTKVLGVFATQDNTTYTVAANKTAKDDDKVKFDGTSYRLDGNGGIATYLDGVSIGNTTLDQLDSNALNPNMYTFVDSDGNGRLDTLVVKSYNVAKVSFSASDRIIAAGITYKYADENIADGIEKDDWVVITRNLFRDCWNVEPVAVETATLDALRDNKTGSIYFDGKAVQANQLYNQYQIGDEWYNGGEDLVQSNTMSENSLKNVKATQSVDYVAVNGIMFSIARSAGTNTGRVDNAALILAKSDHLGVADQVKVAFFNGKTATVSIDDSTGYKSLAQLNVGEVYEYSVSGSSYRFEDLKQGDTDATKAFAEYYGDLTYNKNDNGTDITMTANNVTDLSLNDEFNGLKVDDNAQVLLYKVTAGVGGTETASFIDITGKQLKSLSLNNLDGKNHGLVANATAYGFSGNMSGLTRIGALALEVNANTDLDVIDVRTWTDYGFIVEDAKWVTTGKVLEYKLLLSDGTTVTVREEHNTLLDRTAGTLIGYDELVDSGATVSRALISRADTSVVYTIEGAEALLADGTTPANGDVIFTAITEVSDNGKTVKFANGTEVDISSATVLYVDTKNGTGVADGVVKAATKDNGKYMANALYIRVGGDADILVVDQGLYLKSDFYKNDIDNTNNNTKYGSDLIPGTDTGKSDYVAYETSINSQGHLVVTATATRPSYVPADASITFTAESYINGVYEEQVNINIVANQTAGRDVLNGHYEATDTIELRNIVVTPSKVNVKYVDEKGVDLVASGKVVLTAEADGMLSTSAAQDLDFKIQTSSGGKTLKYTTAGTTADVTTAASFTNNDNVAQQINAKAEGNEAVTITIYGLYDINETYTITAETADLLTTTGAALSTFGSTTDTTSKLKLTVSPKTGVTKDTAVTVKAAFDGAISDKAAYKVSVKLNDETLSGVVSGATAVTLTTTSGKDSITGITKNLEIMNTDVTLSAIDKMAVESASWSGNVLTINFNNPVKDDSAAKDSSGITGKTYSWAQGAGGNTVSAINKIEVSGQTVTITFDANLAAGNTVTVEAGKITNDLVAGNQAASTALTLAADGKVTLPN